MQSSKNLQKNSKVDPFTILSMRRYKSRSHIACWSHGCMDCAVLWCWTVLYVCTPQGWHCNSQYVTSLRALRCMTGLPKPISNSRVNIDMSYIAFFAVTHPITYPCCPQVSMASDDRYSCNVTGSHFIPWFVVWGKTPVQGAPAQGDENMCHQLVSGTISCCTQDSATHNINKKSMFFNAISLEI